MTRQPTGKPPGRPKGSTNKQTLDVKELAQEYTAEAVKALAKIMKSGRQEAARVAAANSILDRGHGKAPVAVNIDANVKAQVSRIELVGVRPGDNGAT